ncbi:hypothetical protein TrLO_g12930 [Triparma laevis f. longispina]|uniref:Uncharacterized protein n=1 Tax=Triparma laevis f. longispina TaxID=1714387 RepID=A0A9W7KZ06_9STRA|nr:hypothetical protein TrLO_g12930 [Triparma laevis f. longispina]
MVLPCFDEEDDGVPPICLTYPLCPFNRENPYLAQNKYVLMFGNVGLPYFDKKRRLFQGIAFVWTLVGFLFTIWGCLAIIPDEGIIRFSYWTWGGTYSGDLAPTDESYAEIFVGLTAFLAKSCTYNTTVVPAEMQCLTEVIGWGDYEDEQGWSGSCAQGTKDFFFTALSSCVPMIFAMIGAMNRMRFKSDAPQQKILGCVTDTFGAASLAAALLTFEHACFSSMSRDQFIEPVGLQDVAFNWVLGPGYGIYWVFCFSGGIVRAAIHWLTPLPGMGVGAFTFKLPTQGFGASAMMGAGAAVVGKSLEAAKKGVEMVDNAANLGVDVTRAAGAKLAKGVDMLDPRLGDATRAVGHLADNSLGLGVNMISEGEGDSTQD